MQESSPVNRQKMKCLEYPKGALPVQGLFLFHDVPEHDDTFWCCGRKVTSFEISLTFSPGCNQTPTKAASGRSGLPWLTVVEGSVIMQGRCGG